MSITWEVSIIEFNDKTYKVTRRIPILSISETLLFKDKKQALKQLKEWSTSRLTLS